MCRFEGVVMHSDMEEEKEERKKKRKREEGSRWPIGKGGPKAKRQEDKMIKERRKDDKGKKE